MLPETAALSEVAAQLYEAVSAFRVAHDTPYADLDMHAHSQWEAIAQVALELYGAHVDAVQTPQVVQVVPTIASPPPLALTLLELSPSDVTSDAPDLFVSEEAWAAWMESREWHPSADQVAALTELRSRFATAGTYVMGGAAGTGKSSSTRAMLAMLTKVWDIHLLAPTWRAVNVLSRMAERQAVTIHSACYGHPTTVRRCTCGEWSAAMMEAEKIQFTLLQDDTMVPWGEAEADAMQLADPAEWERRQAAVVVLPRFVCPHCSTPHEDATRFPERLDFSIRESYMDLGSDFTLVVVDEAGMVAPREQEAIFRTFATTHTVIFYVGDPNQLPYVTADEDDAKGGKKHGVDAPHAMPQDEQILLPFGDADLFTSIDMEHPTVYLEQVHRQGAGDPILTLAQGLKTVPLPDPLPQWPFPLRVAGIDIRTRVGLEVPAAWVAALRQARRDVALITLSNLTRAELNHQVRTALGVVAYAEYHGVNLVPGDLLLARGTNRFNGVKNGEIFTLTHVEEVTPDRDRMLNAHNRANVRKPHYAHDCTLGDSIGVFRLRVTPLVFGGASEPVTPRTLYVVTLVENGKPILESDLLRRGTPPREARDRCRAIAQAWRSEYHQAIDELENEFSDRRKNGELALRAEARWRQAPDGEKKSLQRALTMIEKAGGDLETVRVRRDEVARGVYDSTESRKAGPAIEVVAKVALECNSIDAYARAFYGAINPDEVTVFDFGEALTCHAMQGSQAENVGVVCDGAFWGMWSKDRVYAMKWLYTAVTRAQASLSIFSIRKRGT